MNDQPEVGRPNYSAAGSRPSPSPVPSRQKQPEPRLPIRAVLASFCAVFAWLWALHGFELPLLVPFLVALYGIRLALRAKSNAVATSEMVIAVGAMGAAGLFVFQMAFTALLKYFVYQQGFDSIVKMFLTTH